MKRREVTEEMLRRGINGAAEHNKPFRSEFTSDFIRAILEAALNPPPEPEIEVSDAMLAAGFKAYHSLRGSPDAWDCLLLAYRAMERARREEAGTGHSNRRIHFRKGEPRVYAHHRRSTDK